VAADRGNADNPARSDDSPAVITLARQLQRESAYDADYVVLAQELETDLLTIDGPLVAMHRVKGCQSGSSTPPERINAGDGSKDSAATHLTAHLIRKWVGREAARRRMRRNRQLLNLV
jgi:hypothetical protein